MTCVRIYTFDKQTISIIYIVDLSSFLSNSFINRILLSFHGQNNERNPSLNVYPNARPSIFYPKILIDLLLLLRR